jgi:hypothetical protein
MQSNNTHETHDLEKKNYLSFKSHQPVPEKMEKVKLSLSQKIELKR